MRIFITGGTGFVGNELLKRLADSQHDIAAVHRDERPANWPDSINAIRIDDLADITDEMVSGIDALLHLAGIAHRRAAEPSEFDRVNRAMTERLAVLAAENAVHNFVFLSTAKVYGEVSHGHPFTPHSQLDPPDAYAVSKSAAESALLRIADSSDLRVTILRPPLVIGPGAKGNIALLRRLIVRGIPVPVPYPGNRRAFVSIGTLVDAVMAASETTAAYTVQNVLDPSPNSTAALVDQLSETAKARTIRVPTVLFRSADRFVGKPLGFRLGPLYEDFEIASRPRLEYR